MGYNSLQYLTISNSSLANYIAWASAISAQMYAMGWLQANDTGQVVWTSSVLSISAASQSSGNTTYTYTLTSGPALRVGMSIVITGMTNAGNNVTKTITALGTGTFTVSNAGGVTESGSSGTGTVAAITTVPSTSQTRDYEIWQSNDGLTAFYVQIYYGYSGTQPLMGFGLSTGTNGAGTLTGTVWNDKGNYYLISTTNQASAADCYFCGDSSRLVMLVGRSYANSGVTSSIVIERTKDADGTNNTDGVHYELQGSNFHSTTLAFGVGLAAPVGDFPGVTTTSAANPGFSSLFNNSIAMRPLCPSYGKTGYPITGKMFMESGNATEGSIVTTTLYGQQHTYIVSKAGNLGNSSQAVLTRFD